MYGIDKIKEKKPGKKGLKERTASAPKELLRRGLDDGTERLRGQFRERPASEARGMIMVATRSRTPPGAGAVGQSAALKSC